MGVGVAVGPNLTYFTEFDKGGHFAAWEEPELCAGELHSSRSSTPRRAVGSSTVLLTSVSAWLLMLCLPCLGVVVYLDRRLRPMRPKPLTWWDHVSNVGVWLFIPVVGLILTTLPALDAHTRLLFGKYLHYQVTEKLPAERGFIAPSWTDGTSSAGAA